MKNPMILGDTVQIDGHVELFLKSMHREGVVKRVRYAIFNTFGTDLVYVYDTEKSGQIVNFNYFYNWFNNINTLQLLHNVYWGLSYNQVTKSYSTNVGIYNPVVKDQLPIACWEIFYHDTVTEADVEKYISSFNAHYYEQMCHHLQMVQVNYEKLYYLIDVYTELMINKDKFMPYHMTNVANWCLLLASEMDLNSRDQMVLYIAALIHDIGKLYIPDEILITNNQLTDDERNRLKSHSIKGYHMSMASLYGMTFFMDVPTIIKHHHERFDGTGYPSGLQSTDIPYLSRIIAVADTVDSMMSKRAYKDSESTERIIVELAKCSGKQFDPVIANKMIHILKDLKASSSETSVSDIHFVPQAALSFYYKDVSNVMSLSGNLIIQENKGKLLLHSDMDNIDGMTPEKIHRATLSFYKLTDLIEYTVDIESIMNDQVRLSNFTLIPTDKYFSIVWEGTAFIEHANFSTCCARLVKVGGDTIIFETKGSSASDLVNNRGEILKITMTLEVEDYKTNFELDAKINKFYKFGTQTTFVAKFINISTSDRDKLLRLLFKRQISQKKHRHAAAEGGNDA